jgi:5-methylthioadenosine/S-adenosylhomocysteine deaminase
MPTTLYVADWIHVAGTFRAGQGLLVDETGRVASVGALEQVEACAGDAERIELAGRAICPGTVSAHSHCFQVFLRGWADQPTSFSDWVSRCLYPLVERLDDNSLEAAALLCFTQMVRAGITTVGEFHYVHNAVDSFDRRAEELSRIVIRAARRVGLRIAFLRTVYDVAKRTGQKRFAQSPEEAFAGIRALAEEYHGDDCVSVLPAPHSLHGASREAIEGSAALAAELGGRWHIHLAEQEEDVPFAEEAYGARPLQTLEAWGVLDERTTLVHGIWLDEGERALLAERQGILVSNPTTNMALGDGIAALPDLLDRGVTVALGTDMNACPNVFAEMRCAEYLQRVKALEMGCLAGSHAGDPRPGRIFEMGTSAGGAALGVSTGALESGSWADFLVLDLADPSLLPASLQGGDSLLNAMSSAMVPETAIASSFVGGKEIARNGVPLGLSLGDLAQRVGAAKAVLRR